MLRFNRQVASLITSDSTVLDIGAGAGVLNAYQLKGKCKEIIGVDLDPRVVDNPLLDIGVVANVLELPFSKNSFDVVFAVYVLEHIEDATGFVSQIKKVLKPGGHFLAITPIQYHYVALIARLTPDWFHKWFRRKLYNVTEEDTFPTPYLMNAPRKVEKAFF